MDKLIPFPDGGYRFIHGVFPYSAGVAAQPGFVIGRGLLHRESGPWYRGSSIFRGDLGLGS